MAASDYYSLLKTNGGDVQYVWHVAGYPYAVATTQACADALMDSTTHMRKIFGNVSFTLSGEVYPADTCKIFSTLQRDGLGNQTWKIDEKKGALQGGSWAVKIADIDLGYDWPHKPTGDTIRGLEGIHRVANVRDSTVQGWGQITANLKINDTTITIEEQSYDKIHNRVDSCSGDEFIVLWIGHEAIAVSSLSGTHPDYTLNICNSGAGRGLYKTREQDHFVSFYSGTNPIIADVPGSIIGHYCRLWAVPMDGSSVLGSPVLERQGVVSDRVVTRRSITQVSINTPLDAIKENIPTPKRAPRANMAKFVFSRGDSGTEKTNCREYWQCPHLLIREYNSATNYFDPKAIWLCAQNSNVEFDTIQDVMVALNNELALCRTGSTDQISGDGTSGNSHVTLSYEYHCPLNGGVMTQNETDAAKISLITGPLAWLFGLGERVMTGNGDPDVLPQVWKYRQQVLTEENYQYYDYCFTQMESPGTWHSFMTDHTFYWLWVDNRNSLSPDVSPALSQRYTDFNEIDYYTINRFAFQAPQFVMQWDWKNQPPNEAPPNSSGSDSDVISVPRCGAGSAWFAPNAGKINLAPDTDINAFITNELFYLGDTDNPKQLYGSIDSLGTSAEYPSIVPTTNAFWNTCGTAKMKIGETLFYIPFVVRDPEEEIVTTYESDHWIINQAYAELSSDKLSDLLRALLGETITGITVPRYLRLTWVPFFTDVSVGGSTEFASMIDWDSMDDKFKKISSGHQYSLPLDDKISIYNILRNETMFHGCHMTLEWDPTDEMEKIKFRHIGPINATNAINTDRRITSADKVFGTDVIESHNDRHLCNKLDVKCNYKDSQYTREFTIDAPALYAIVNRDENVLSIQSKVSVIPSLDLDIGAATIQVYEHFADNILRYMAEPSQHQKTKATIASRFKIAVGREAVITDTSARVPYTHELGLDEDAVLVTEKSYNIARAEIRITYRIGHPVSYGWAPACRVAANNSTKVDGSTMWCTVEDHNYTPTTDRKDWEYFDCLDYDPAEGTIVPRTTCSCGNYAVLAFEEGDSTTSTTGYTCYVDQDNSRLYLLGTNTSWDTTEPHIIVFNDYSSVQPCQKKYVYFSDYDHQLGDGGTAHRWI